MYRLMIVDDEERIVNSIYDLMEERFDFELYRCYSSIQALSLVKRMRFDVIISDVAMPQMNGLELVKEVRKIWPKCHFLLLTAYDSFEYVYQASQYERVDYLLKVESYDTICECIARKRAYIEQERQQEEQLKNYHSNLRQLNSSMRGYFLKRMIVIGALPEQSDLDEISFPVRLADPVFFVMAATDACGAVEHGRIAAMVDDWVRDQLQEYGLESYSHTSAFSHSILFVVQFAEKGEHMPEEMPVYIRTVFENLPPLVEKQFSVRMSVLCPDAFVRWSQVHALYQRCVIRMEDMKNESGMMLLSVEQELNRHHISVTFPNIDEIGLLWKLIKDGSLTDFRSAMEQGLAELCAGEDIRMLQNHPSVTAVGYLLAETAKLYAPEALDTDTFRRLTQCVGFSNGREWLDEVLLAVEKMLNSQKKARASSGAWLVEQINRYIDIHYAEDITLTALAELMHYSPSYLSRFYKSQSGVNVMNHLYDVRIRKACDLLTHTNIKMADVAKHTGFCSAKYFNRVFKKTMGLSATQYREENGHIRS